MGSRRTPGLRKRSGIWHIQKKVRGYGTLYESTGTGDKAEAERYLARRLEQIRCVVVYGDRPTVTFNQAAEKYLKENGHLKSLERIGYSFDAALPYIGHLALEQVHDGTLAPFKAARLDAGLAAGTINKDLSAIRRVLNLAARVWRHPNGMTFLETAPLIQLLSGKARKPFPLTWEQQTTLFAELPAHLERMALFMVNTGLRRSELCGLRWQNEVAVPELETSVFILTETKNEQERVLVLNDIARRVLESVRGDHPEAVFTYKGEPMKSMLTTAWKKARERAGLANVRVHDLRHTFGHRLRAAGVSFEDRQDLLGHASGRMTTHYSTPELSQLLKSANLICEKRPATVLRVISDKSGAKLGQSEWGKKTGAVRDDANALIS